MTGRKIILIAISVLYLSLCLDAKEPPADLGYDPPEGWEFVMKLDSASGMFLHSHNDTCFISAVFSGGKPNLYHLSTDGGENWEKIPTFPGPNTFKYNSNTQHRFMVEGNQRYYEKSYDFFKTSEKYPAVNISIGFKELLESPIDTNIMISSHYGKYDTHWATIEGMAAQISRNAGRNWEFLDLYIYPKGYAKYTFNFDWAEKGHWFYRAEDGYDDLDYKKLPDKYFETFDDGMTFREIQFNPADHYYIKVFLGLDGKNTLRTFSIKQTQYLDSASMFYRNYQTCNGIILSEYNTEILNYKNINWLKLIDPTKPNTNLDSGYVFSLNHLNFHFDHSNYSNQLIDAYERTDFDIQKYSSKEFNSFLNISHSLGNSWEIYTYSKNQPRIINTFLDQGTKILWIHTHDENFDRSKSYGSTKGSLWKLKLPWESTRVKDVSNNKSGIVIYPNPADEIINIKYEMPGTENQIINYSLYNMFGFEVFRTVGISGQPIIIPTSNLTTGAYFLKAEQKVFKNEKNVMIKTVIIQR